MRGGDRPSSTDAPGFKLGLTICYDVRFPALYRALAEAGAEVIAVPAAFTVPTGRGALGDAAARPRHRDRLLRHRRGAGRRSTRTAARPMAIR